jgi:mono/diheme cytochrome c family protein
MHPGLVRPGFFLNSVRPASVHTVDVLDSVVISRQGLSEIPWFLVAGCLPLTKLRTTPFRPSIVNAIEMTAPLRPTARGLRSRSHLTCVGLGLAAFVAFGAAPPASDLSQLPPAATRSIDFVKDVQPILAAHCYECHGSEKQKSGLRLDLKTAAFQGGENHAPDIHPQDGSHSPLIQFVAGLVPEMQMPPKGERLTAGEIGILRAWIDQGAEWPVEAGSDVDPIASHWAFRPVKRPEILGNFSGKIALRNPIDAFIQAKLAQNELALSPEAGRPTLIRRLYLELLGMPPSPAEVEAFVSDPRPDAFERLVDRALEDSRYGERWARHWLDIIRFAESNGFETNRERPNAWRFRDYVIDALNADKPYDEFVREQLAGDAFGVDVATGFLVGGPVDIVKSPDIVLTLQQRADELDDMVNTTGTAFLGLTLGCVRCHSHKFDPIAHREYYAMAAIFSGVQHGDRARPLPSARQKTVTELDAKIHEREEQLGRFLAPEPIADGPSRPPVDARKNDDEFAPVEARFVRFTIRASTGAEPGLDELEVWARDRNVALASNGTRATASGTLPGYAIHKLEHVNDGKFGNEHSWISNESGRGWVQLEFARPETINRVTWGRDREGHFGDRLATDYLIEVATEPGKWRTVATSAGRKPSTSQPATKPEPVYQFEKFGESEGARGREWLAELKRLRKERETAAKPEMVYAGSFGKPAPTFRLHRGDPTQKREPVTPGTLAIFKPVGLDAESSDQERRLRLAEWIASTENPLTARVIVNRVWQHHFGTGFVDTPNDFGKNGSKPSHPELLDWLADELVHPTSSAGADPSKAWSLKHLHRLILTSATWRQSDAPRIEALKKDAACRLLWRFPPRRLEAETLRDSILAVSGNLDRTMGGPSFFLHDVDRENVYHYRPKEEFGPEESRRMVYAFKVRMEQDGIFGAFDCPDGSLVVPRRSVSTTPLQALNLFNSRFILRQSDVFAERLRREAGSDPASQVHRAWLLAFGRTPDAVEAGDAVAFIRAEGLVALCRALLNANEFLFLP